jgi:hypothetical protein
MAMTSLLLFLLLLIVLLASFLFPLLSVSGHGGGSRRCQNTFGSELNLVEWHKIKSNDWFIFDGFPDTGQP